MRGTSCLSVVLMGASGAGKSALGQSLSDATGYPFLEGDDFHSPRNLELMSSGMALTDADRWPWLDRLGGALRAAGDGSDGVIASCSALRRVYRERLQSAAGQQLLFVFLEADRSLLEQRMSLREGHYMPVSLLDSQIAALETPEIDEWSMTLSATRPLDELTTAALACLEQARRE